MWVELRFELIYLRFSNNPVWNNFLDMWYFTLHSILRRKAWTYIKLLLVLLDTINKAHSWGSVFFVSWWWIHTHVFTISVGMSYYLVSLVNISILRGEVLIGMVWIFVRYMSWGMLLVIYPWIYLITLGMHHLYWHRLIFFCFSFILFWYVIISLK